MPLVVTNSAPAAAQPLANPSDGLRDIAPPIEIPSGYEWLWWTLGTIALVVALILLARWLQRRRQQQLFIPPVPAHLRARLKLEQALALIAQPKPFCIAVSDALRTYLEERFTFRAPERTTEEFLHELRATTLLTAAQKNSLSDFLTNCDLVKFAKYEPGEPELRDLHASALRLVVDTQPSPEQLLAQQVTAPTVPQGVGTKKGKRMALTGAILQILPVIWSALYLVTVIRLATIAMSAGKDNPGTQAMAVEAAIEQMGDTLWIGLIFGIAAVLLGLFGLVLLILALVKSRCRAKWLFWFTLVYGVMLLPAIPFGSLFGIFFIVYALVKQREFFPPQPRPSPAG